MNKLKHGAWIFLVGLWGCQPAGNLPTPQPTVTPSATATPAPTPTPTASPTPAPTASPTPAPTATPTPLPTATPTPEPTASPTPAPTATPTPSASPLSFGDIKVIAGSDSSNSNAKLENGIRAENTLLPEKVSGLTVDAEANLWFLNASNESLGQITAEIVRNTTSQGDIKYRLYWEKVAKLPNQGGMVQDVSGDYYVVQTNLHRVVRVNPTTGSITPVAGTGQQRFNGDGKALETNLNLPTDIARDSLGNFYITDTGNHLIRKLTPDGRLITIAGVYTQDLKVTDTDGDGRLDDEVPTYDPIGDTTGDGGFAREARVKNPREITVGPDNAIYFSSDSNTIRRIFNDKIDKYAGTGTKGYNGAGFRAELANFNQIGDLQFGPDGLLYFADQDRIRRLTPQPNGELWIEDIAGNGRENDLVEVLADPLKAELRVGPLAFDAVGNLYVYDVAHRRLRMLESKNGNN